ncbi:MAG: hypothetical protein LBP87_12065, partial [Planctomycetaceae bacterium]|nr:hypothetical protein [Planctomycetaceae bacterium]
MSVGIKSLLVTVNVLGVMLDAKFKKTKSDYVSIISQHQAEECYKQVLRLLSNKQIDSNISVNVFFHSSGKRTVTLYRYDKTEKGKITMQY